MSIRRLALIALSALFLLGLGTYIAGEQTEVARLRTFEPAGSAYETKMWVVDLDGRSYVRIGRAGRGWGKRLKAQPQVELIRDAGTVPCTASIVTDDAARRRIDESFAVKYGWVDWWYGVVLRSNAETVKLEPRAP